MKSAKAIVLGATVCLAVIQLRAADTAWLQWGGPRRNFMVDTTGLADKWPSGGPKRLWTRSLGEGHSAVVVEGDSLYTMHPPGGVITKVRRAQQETIAA